MNPPSELQQDEIYRPTKNVSPGTYYTVPKTVTSADVVRRLERQAAKLTGRDAWLLRRLSQGWLLLRRHRRYCDQAGARRESTEYVAVPADHHFRAVKSKPGYGGTR